MNSIQARRELQELFGTSIVLEFDDFGGVSAYEEGVEEGWLLEVSLESWRGTKRALRSAVLAALVAAAREI